MQGRGVGWIFLLFWVIFSQKQLICRKSTKCIKKIQKKHETNEKYQTIANKRVNSFGGCRLTGQEKKSKIFLLELETNSLSYFVLHTHIFYDFQIRIFIKTLFSITLQVFLLNFLGFSLALWAPCRYKNKKN